jgi:hypothetical protein
MIGKLLGHTQPATTARYAHLATVPFRAASFTMGTQFAAVMNSENPLSMGVKTSEANREKNPERA